MKVCWETARHVAIGIRETWVGQTNSKRQSTQSTQAAVAAGAAEGQLAPQPGVEGRAAY